MRRNHIELLGGATAEADPVSGILVALGLVIEDAVGIASNRDGVGYTWNLHLPGGPRESPS